VAAAGITLVYSADISARHSSNRKSAIYCTA